MWEIYRFVNNIYCHFVEWKNDQNKSCRPWEVVQICCWWLFQLESFANSKSCLKLSFFQIENLNCSNKVRWRNDQNKNCRSWWVLQICGLWLFHLKSFAIRKLCHSSNILNLNFLICWVFRLLTWAWAWASLSLLGH
jgi:hypothetical protein